MAAGIKNFLIEKGSTWNKTMHFGTGNAANPTPFSLVGYTVRMEIRLKNDDSTPLMTLSNAVDNGKITIVSVTGGIIKAGLTKTETAALSFQEAYYRIIADNGTDAKRWLEGKIIIG